MFTYGGSKINRTSRVEHEAACVGHADLFLHPLFDEPTMTLSREQRRTYAMMAVRANRLCEACPMATRCLYQAIVDHDVAGFVAGTTPGQRQAIRARLRWNVAPDSVDRFIGVSSPHQIDHDEVVRMRRSCPSETLETIATRMGCSLSTVKRHLRQARDEGRPVPERPRLSLVPPSVDQVLDARDAVLNRVPKPADLRLVA